MDDEVFLLGWGVVDDLVVVLGLSKLVGFYDVEDMLFDCVWLVVCFLFCFIFVVKF